MTADVPAQRTEPDTSGGICGADSPNRYVCTQVAGHDGPHRATDPYESTVYDEWTASAPADLPLTEAIAVERLALDDPDEQALLDAYKEAKDAADKAESVVAEANDDAERACRYADDCAEALLRAKTAFAQARLKLIGVL